MDAFEALAALQAPERAGVYLKDRVHLSVEGHRFLATTTTPQPLEVLRGR